MLFYFLDIYHYAGGWVEITACSLGKLHGKNQAACTFSPSFSQYPNKTNDKPYSWFLIVLDHSMYM